MQTLLHVRDLAKLLKSAGPLGELHFVLDNGTAVDLNMIRVDHYPGAAAEVTLEFRTNE